MFRFRIRFYRRRRRTKTKAGLKSRKHYLIHKETARSVIEERLKYFQKEFVKIDQTLAVHLVYKRLSVRNVRSRWGSCSSAKNLNFNYKLVHLSSELRDYVIVHELCHLKELNHGADFWNLVEKVIPNARMLNRQVRKINSSNIV